jgi:hypothetical protein
MEQQTAQDVTYIIADVNNRVRSLESQYHLMGERILIINQNMIEEYKKIIKEIRAMNSELRTMKAEVAEVKAVAKDLITEMQGFAKKEDIKVIDKYLKLWSPMNFVTEEQLQETIKNMKKGK